MATKKSKQDRLGTTRSEESTEPKFNPSSDTNTGEGLERDVERESEGLIKRKIRE